MDNAMTNRPALIKTDADALAFFNGGKGMDISEGKGGRLYVTKREVCSRCGGTGIWAMGAPNAGICYECGGANSTIVTKHCLLDYAKRERTAEMRRNRAAAKRKAQAPAREAAAAARKEARLEKQRDWCEANGFGRVTFDEKKAVVESQRAAERATHVHVGTVGKRQEFTLTRVHTIDWETDYGFTYLHIMADADGNKFVWKTSKGAITCPNYETYYQIGDTFTCKATVKDHDERDGEKQTVLTRLTVTK